MKLNANKLQTQRSHKQKMQREEEEEIEEEEEESAESNLLKDKVNEHFKNELIKL